MFSAVSSYQLSVFLSADSGWWVSGGLAAVGLIPRPLPLSALPRSHETGADRETPGNLTSEERGQSHRHDIISRPLHHTLTMESTADNSNNNKSAAAELQTSVLQLPKRLPASCLLCRSFLWPPLQPLPCLPSQPSPHSSSGSSRLCPGQSAVTVPSVPKFRLIFYPSRELFQHQAGIRASGFSHLPLPDPARLPFPIPGFSLWPVHAQRSTERPCTLPGHLQLWRLQLPGRACLFQFCVTNGKTHLQTRIWSSTAVLLKALLFLHLNSSLLCCLPLLSSLPTFSSFFPDSSLSSYPNSLPPSSCRFTFSTFRFAQIQEVSRFTYLCCTISLSLNISLLISSSFCLSFSPSVSPYDQPTPPTLVSGCCVVFKC